MAITSGSKEKYKAKAALADDFSPVALLAVMVKFVFLTSSSCKGGTRSKYPKEAQVNAVPANTD